MFASLPTRIALSALLLAPSILLAADRSGKEVVESVCIACHGTGKDGAPRIGNATDWAPRAAKGLDKLSQNAITGVRKMPAHGGQAKLTDLEMSRATAYMISGGVTPDTAKPYATTTKGSGEHIVDIACGGCHKEGKGGAPKIGDLEAWRPRLQKGMDGLVTSATSGHNGMPARGGFADMSDSDIRAAVSFMVSKISGPTKP